LLNLLDVADHSFWNSFI